MYIVVFEIYSNRNGTVRHEREGDGHTTWSGCLLQVRGNTSKYIANNYNCMQMDGTISIWICNKQNTTMNMGMNMIMNITIVLPGNVQH